MITTTRGINFAYVSAGGGHTCGLTSPSSLAYCWGRNSSGQLGNGTTTDSATPLPVLGGISFAFISAGADHTCAGTQYGNVWCWGDNSYGQLGDSTVTQRSTPTDVTGLSNGMLTVVAGNGHTCALTNSGGAKCWGRNDTGQIGDGSVETGVSRMPLDVIGLTSGVNAIFAGSCALTSIGGVK